MLVLNQRRAFIIDPLSCLVGRGFKPHAAMRVGIWTVLTVNALARNGMYK